MHRQIRALLDAGHEVTYVAPFTYYNVTPMPPIKPIDVARGGGLGRARVALHRGAKGADLLLVHDIDLLRILPLRRPPVVWDVREEATGPLRRAAVRRAARRHHVIDRSIVPEATQVCATPPPSGNTRVVHLGRLTAERGVVELIELAQRLVPHGIRLDLIGAADREVRPLLRDAQRVGLLDWYGHVPHRHALRMAEGALAGLSLGATGTPTKVLDYMGRGLPVIATTDVGDAGLTVPMDVDEVLHAVLDLKEDPVRRAQLGARGHAEARLHHHWPDHAPAFVAHLEEWAGLSAHALAV